MNKSCASVGVPMTEENKTAPNPTNEISGVPKRIHNFLEDNPIVMSKELKANMDNSNSKDNFEDADSRKQDFQKTKGETKYALSVDETDHVQKRLSGNISHTKFCHDKNQMPETIVGKQHFNIENCCTSPLSSAMSTPSCSTDTSPLTTPTRFLPIHKLQHNHENCCHKASTGKQYGHKHQHVPSSCRTNSKDHASLCRNKKPDARLNPSPYRQLLPIALCILSFATVFATLIVYMDTTEIRHQQFRLNMSRDYELNGVAQDDPALIAFLREIHMRKYSMHLLKNRDPHNDASLLPIEAANSFSGSGTSEQHLNISSLYTDKLANKMAHYVAHLVGGKKNGAVFQSLTGPLAHLITAPLLSETLNWMGVLVEPEPRWYFSLRKENNQRPRMQVVHACVSPNPYPKEITIHNEDVRINSLYDEETSWFNSRVKCFPLFTIMLACDRVDYDLLSLGVQGQELEILQTVPFDKVNINVISIHLIEDQEDVHSYVQAITKFLAGKSYKLLNIFGRNYFYQRINFINRSRKKDILLLKTP